ncbi:hypothetical protein [Clostridium perfringens]|uniref:hypothetical protein n=1 Tax=Clostridium perfringens TaxID=1502 RepID=UPI003CED66E4
MSFFRKRSIGTGINDVGVRNNYFNILEIMECPKESYFEEENVIEDDYREEFR